MKYNYQARTKQGDIYSGSIEASSEELAVSILRERGLYPTFLEKDTVPIFARKIEFFERITKKDIALFSRQLSIMFKSNISLIESLRAFANETKNPNFKEKILSISENIEGGTAFSQALSRYPKIFSSFYIAVVKSGEASGKLSKSLDYLADHLERDYHLTNKIRGALIYPAFVIFSIFLVLFLLISFVLPSLIEVFEAGEHELPFATRAIIALTNFAGTWWWLILFGLVFLVIFSLKYHSTKEGKRFFDGIFLKIPIVGPFLQTIYLNQFAENFSTLISSGLPVIQSLEITGSIINNVFYQEAIDKAKQGIGRGEMLSLTLSQFPELFPSVFIQMVLVGERTGRLDSTLMNVVVFLQEEITRGIDNILSVLEPILIIFLGSAVGVIMISILMPLYQIMSF